jgi:magnesium-transporting ATPase (P-type)
LDRNENRTVRLVNYKASPGIQKDYELLEKHEFTPQRKRMSIIVKDLQLNQFILFCKGADQVMFERAACNTVRSYDECLQSFSNNGWRTLVCAYKLISLDKYATYKKLVEEANNDFVNREDRLDKVYDLIESGLSILGVTAVEDKLQDGVEDTLFALKKAGVRVWVITGDMLETAVSVSELCKHISPDMKQHVFRDLKNSDCIKEKTDQS